VCFVQTYTYNAQIIDDEKGKVLVIASDKELKGKASNKDKKMTAKSVISFEVGKLISKKAKDLKIESVIFDRGGHKYHGRVKSLADGAREGGLKF